MGKYFHFRSDDHSYDVPLVSVRCNHIDSNTNHHCKKRCLIGLSKCWIHLLSDHHLRIKPSNILNAGSGVFTQKRKDHATRVFKTNDKICEFEGNVIDQHNLTQRYKKSTPPYGILLRKVNGIQMYEDGAEYRGIGSLINHSANNSKINCRFSLKRNNRIQILATKNINKDTELLVNYGKDYRMNGNNNVYSSTNNKKNTI